MSQHIVPKRVYLLIFAALLVLTAITVWVAFKDLGPLNDVVALGIAVVKATLVILYFMHVRYSSGLTWVLVVAGFLFLVILLSLTMSDVATRHWLPQPPGWTTP